MSRCPDCRPFTENKSRFCRLNPRFTDSRFESVRTKSPAATRIRSERAICPATRTRLKLMLAQTPAKLNTDPEEEWRGRGCCQRVSFSAVTRRSEEHTSELQS